MEMCAKIHGLMASKGNWMRSGIRLRIVALAAIIAGALGMSGWEFFGDDPCEDVADQICEFAWIDDCAVVRRALAEPDVDVQACEDWRGTIAEMEMSPQVISSDREGVYRMAMAQLLAGRMDVAAMHDERSRRRAEERTRPLPRERRNSDD
jgi:hypothetical protein